MLEVPDGSIVRRESVRYGPFTHPILHPTSTCSKDHAVEFVNRDVWKSAIWVTDSRVAQRAAHPIFAILDRFLPPFSHYPFQLQFFLFLFFV
ncbi:hypothetical protein L5515_010804 [Caenorhabditis briggsae]|uniref:Uncharacterized protein n=1 Tax=Caenorhabditis briggsae TaxID=6238 RepID=A0AAE9D659_CAEBR|nr:hypothetical protein L3Y34_003654 [Caenorhabditis briggsae]UMM27556.1 hypothetical protein L5515_010804 [Caenorhabditis briggsae]